MAKELSLMGQLRKEADRDFSKYLKYVNEIFEENKMLHEEQGRLHRLWSKDTKHIAELEEENRKLKEELAHYKNTEAIQKSNNASRYNPYNHKSYVDREFNVIN